MRTKTIESNKLSKDNKTVEVKINKVGIDVRHDGLDGEKLQRVKLKKKNIECV